MRLTFADSTTRILPLPPSQRTPTVFTGTTTHNWFRSYCYPNWRDLVWIMVASRCTCCIRMTGSLLSSNYACFGKGTELLRRFKPSFHSDGAGSRCCDCISIVTHPYEHASLGFPTPLDDSTSRRARTVRGYAQMNCSFFDPLHDDTKGTFSQTRMDIVAGARD